MSICLKNIVYCKSCGRTIGNKYFKFKKMVNAKNDRNDNRDILKKLNITCAACKIVVTTTVYNNLLINL